MWISKLAIKNFFLAVHAKLFANFFRLRSKMMSDCIRNCILCFMFLIPSLYQAVASVSFIIGEFFFLEILSLAEELHIYIVRVCQLHMGMDNPFIFAGTLSGLSKACFFRKCMRLRKELFEICYIWLRS